MDYMLIISMIFKNKIILSFVGIEKVKDMAKFGYILKTPMLETLEEDKKWMEDFGCVDVIVEPVKSGDRDRFQWDQLTEKLQCGDTIVVPKLSNALHGARQLVFFLEFCRIQNIRLVSIHDKIDTSNALFPEAKTSDVLTAIALLPKEANAIRKYSSHVSQIRRKMASSTTKSISKAERNRKIVGMYLEGYSIEDIHAKSGFRSRSSVFRILKDANVNLRREWKSKHREK